MDAGQMREELSRKFAAAMRDEQFACFAEAYEHFESEIERLACVAKIPSGYVFACMIDDYQAGINE